MHGPTDHPSILRIASFTAVSKKTVRIKIQVPGRFLCKVGTTPPANSVIIGFFRAFLRRRLIAAVHFNIGVMGDATFFPVIPYFFADK